MKILKTVRYSICDCGFPLLDESIPVGTEYKLLNEWIAESFTMTCGGCGKDIQTYCAYVQRENGTPGWLPFIVFLTPDEEIKFKEACKKALTIRVDTSVKN